MLGCQDRASFNVGSTQCKGPQLLQERALWRGTSRHVHLHSHLNKIDSTCQLLGDGEMAFLLVICPGQLSTLVAPREWSWLAVPCSFTHLPTHLPVTPPGRVGMWEALLLSAP